MPVQQLLRYAALRLQAVSAGVTAIERKRDLVSVRFRQDAPVDAGKLASFVASQRGSQFLPDGTLKFLAKGLGARELLEQLQKLLENLFEAKSSPSLA
jgi:transcription-repair coupling factor (superfamily II helicase)